MGSAEQDASNNKSDIQAKTDDGQEVAARPPLVRPVRPVRPPMAPESSAVAVKPAPKAAETAAATRPAVAAVPEPDPEAYRYQPIAPPSEPMQYRAIGLVRGTYEPSEADQLNRGNLTTEDGHVIDSVLLGRITSLVKKHIDLSASHLWVVYPRTRRELDNDDQDLHLQIVGVWEPETLGLPGEAPSTDDDEADDDKVAEDKAADKPDLSDLPPVDDNFFSIRGEVVKYTPEDQCIAVKILQAAKRSPGTAKPFKLLLHGTIEGRTVGYFWDFKVKRDAKLLVLTEASMVGIVPPKKRPKGGGGGPRRGKPGMRSGPGGSRPPMPSRKPTGVKGSDRPKKREPSPTSSPETTSPDE
jgi:hypothetical protein